jgi:RNA polymerase sigma-70 factor (ECF subfamily)
MERDWQGATDGALVDAIVRQESEAAGTELFRRYRKRVYVWCFNMAHDRDEAVDLTQEIFIRAFQGLEGFDGRARFSTWLYQIARNHCLNVVGARKRQWRKSLADLEGVDAPDPGVVDQLEKMEQAGELDRLLKSAARTMKGEELEAFVLHYRDGMTVKEISRLLKCENQTGARTLIQNARRKFGRLTGPSYRRQEP